MSSKTKQTNENEHVDGVTNSVQRMENQNKKSVEEFNEEIQIKFWKLQNDLRRTSKKDEWEEFNKKIAQEVSECGGKVVLKISSKGKVEINCQFWKFPYPVEIRGAYPSINFEFAKFEKGLTIVQFYAERICCSESEIEGYAKFIKSAVIIPFVKFLNCEVSFSKADFSGISNLDGCKFENSTISFYDSIFQHKTLISTQNPRQSYGGDAKGMPDFNPWQIIGEVSFEFCNCIFRDWLEFSVGLDQESFYKVGGINFENCEFHKSTRFYDKSKEEKYVRIGKINFSKVIFRDPVILDFKKLEEAPDFSKAHLIDPKKLSLNEASWEKNGKIDESKIVMEDEPKFRFLKKYFAEQVNHFKEQQYFSYELQARRKNLASKCSFKNFSPWNWCRYYCELTIFDICRATSSFEMRGEIDANKIAMEDEPKFRFLKKYFAEQVNHFKEQQYFSYELQARRKNLASKCSFKNFSPWNWFKNYSELFVFSIYQATSNFGMSWVRPLLWLAVSSQFMALRLDKIAPDSALLKAIEFLNFPRVKSILGLNIESSTVGFFDAFAKTIIPFLAFKDFADPFDWLGNFYCLINGALIFLLLLGLRNKFKIK